MTSNPTSYGMAEGEGLSIPSPSFTATENTINLAGLRYDFLSTRSLYPGAVDPATNP